MDATKVEQFHFRAKTGSSATRANSKGDSEFGDPLNDLPSYLEQYKRYKARRNEIRRLLSMQPPFHEREALQKELANCLREIGSMRQILAGGARLAFEKVFMAVASKRLPKDHFLSLVDEAREVWRAEGWASFIPSQSQNQKRRAIKTTLRRIQSQSWAA